MKNFGALLAIAGLAALGLFAASQSKTSDKPATGKPPSGKPPSGKPPVKPSGPAVPVSMPGEPDVIVTLPSQEQLEDIFEEALEAANKAEAEHGPAQETKPENKPAAVKPAAVKPAAVKPATGTEPDYAKAAKLAPGVAKNIRTKKFDYSRQALKDFQRAEGIAVDGIYGPESEHHLAKYGPAPKALFKRKK